MNARRILVWVVAGALVLLVVRCTRSCRGGAQDAGALTAVATRGALVISVRAAGEIGARDSNKIVPQMKRPAQLGYLVPEGQRVAKDEVIARFNTEEIEQRLSDAESSLAAADQNLLSAQTDLEIERMESATNLKIAEQALRSAELELEKFLDGDDPMERRTAELKVRTTESKYTRSTKRYAEIQGLLAEGFVTEDQVEEERIGAETAEVEFETAKSELEILKTYTLPLKKTTAENTVAKAATEFEKTRKKSEVQLRNREQAAIAAQRTVAKSRTNLEQVKEEQKTYEVRAPTDGVVTYGDPENPWRRSEIIVGSTISPGQVLMTIPDMSAMLAVINVPEADVAKVQTGQVVTVTVEAVPGRTFQGAVTRVAEVANASGWWGAAVKEFKVQATLQDAGGLKPGFSCDAEIVTDVASSALMVPVQAVFRDGDAFHSYKTGLAGPIRAPVRIGRSSATHVEILDGLAEGDRVLLSEPAAREKRD